MVHIGKRISEWREHKGLTPQELAEKVGVTPAAVYQWEGTGESKTTPSLANLEKVCRALGISLAKFHGELPPKSARAS